MSLAREGLRGLRRKPDCSGLGSQGVERLALLIQPRQLGLPTHRCGFDMRQERVRPHVPHTCRWAGEAVGGGQAGRALGVHSLEWREQSGVGYLGTTCAHIHASLGGGSGTLCKAPAWGLGYFSLEMAVRKGMKGERKWLAGQGGKPQGLSHRW